MEKQFVIYHEQKKLLAERLKYLIAQHGGTKAYFISETGKRRKDLNRILEGDGNLTIETICIILGALKIHLVDFILSPEFIIQIRSRAEEEKYVNECNKQQRLKMQA
jgi:transcriptional regulator with XRE-family HTH domain